MWHASGITSATYKLIPATRSHKYGIILGAHLGTTGRFCTLKKAPGELRAWEKKGKRGLLPKLPWFFSGKFLSLRLREVKPGLLLSHRNMLPFKTKPKALRTARPRQAHDALST